MFVMYNILINFIELFVGVVSLEMCDALIKIAIRLTSDCDSSTLSNTIPFPVVIEKAKNYLDNSIQVLQHEDPDGPESGGLIAGAKQMEISLAQFL